MFDVSKIAGIKTEVAAITCIMCVDLYFLSKAFEYRDKFQLYEFYGLVGAVQILVLLLCNRLSWIYVHRQLADEMRELSLQSLTQIAGKEPTAAGTKTERKKTKAVAKI